MDQNSGHHILHTRGHHTGSHLGACAVLPFPPEAPHRSPDLGGALDPGVHICPLSAGSPHAALYHALLPRIQFKLQGWKRVC